MVIDVGYRRGTNVFYLPFFVFNELNLTHSSTVNPKKYGWLGLNQEFGKKCSD